MRHIWLIVLAVGFVTVACTGNDESSGTTTPTAVSIFSQGTLSIDQAFSADLDRGTVGTGDDYDIWFQAETDRFVTPLDGVTAAVVGTATPGRDGCAALTLLDDRINIDALVLGTYLCVRTNEGRLSEVRVTGLPGPSPGILVIQFTTYS